MVRAGDDPSVTASGKKQTHPVEADVRECTDLSVIVAHDEDGLAGKLEGEIVAALRDGIRTAGTDPFPGEDIAKFPGEKFPGRVDTRRCGPCLPEGTFRVGLEFADERVDRILGGIGGHQHVTCPVAGWRSFLDLTALSTDPRPGRGQVQCHGGAPEIDAALTSVAAAAIRAGLFQALSGGVAQLVEQGNHNPWVGGSSPSSATTSPNRQPDPAPALVSSIRFFGRGHPARCRCHDGHPQIVKGLLQDRIIDGFEETFEMRGLLSGERPQGTAVPRFAKFDTALFQFEASDNAAVGTSVEGADALQNHRFHVLYHESMGRRDAHGEDPVGNLQGLAVSGQVLAHDFGPVRDHPGPGETLAAECASGGFREDPPQMPEPAVRCRTPAGTVFGSSVHVPDHASTIAQSGRKGFFAGTQPPSPGLG